MEANASNNDIMFLLIQYQGLAVSTDITIAELKETLNTFTTNSSGKGKVISVTQVLLSRKSSLASASILTVCSNKRGCSVCKFRGFPDRMLGPGWFTVCCAVRVRIQQSTYRIRLGHGAPTIIIARYGISDIRSLYNGDIGYHERSVISFILAI